MKSPKKLLFIKRHVLELQPLEIRQLLSTINVADFGARPNDGQDDRGAIIAAINASRDGDTILFSGGTFNVSDLVTFKGNRTYKGASGATLAGRSGKGNLVDVHSDNVTFTGLTFDGGGVFLDKPTGGKNQNVVFDHNTFKLNSSGEWANGISIPSGLQNSRITNNYFTGYGGSFGIYGYNYRNLTITNNEFVNVPAGMHIDAFGDSGNLLVQNNYITGAKGMGMEFQGTADGDQFLDNWYENPNLQGGSSRNPRNENSMAFSLILDKSRNIVVKRNTVIAPTRADTVGCRVGIEMGGDNSIVEDNYINGPSVSAFDTDGAGSGSVTFRNNKIMNVQFGDYQAFPAPGRTYQAYNNGPNTVLSWDINRDRPGIDGSAGNNSSVPTESAEQPAPSTGSDPSSPTSAVATWDRGDLISLTTLDAVSATNGWGPVEFNQANGDRRANDGMTISLGGKEYENGIGVAINSEVVYNLDGKYSRFFSDIGVDDYAGDEGSMTFEVWADGVKVYDSGTMRGGDDKKGVTLRVAGVQQLKLVTTNADDGNRKDLGDWAAPRLLPTSAISADPVSNA